MTTQDVPHGRDLLYRLNEPTLQVPLNWVESSLAEDAVNLGDALSPVVVAAISGRPVLHVANNDSRERLVAIGTIGQLQRGATVHIWGTGYSRQWAGALAAKTPSPAVAPARFVVHATRGPISASAFAELGFNSPGIYGDPAWYLPRILPLDNVQKKYELGVILHISEVEPKSQDGAPLARFVRYQIPPSLKNAVKIITTYVRHSLAGMEDCLSLINSCRRVVSTSFHGFVLAEAYGIPAAYFSLHSGGMKRLDPLDSSHAMNERFRDFMQGVNLHVPRGRPTSSSIPLLAYCQERNAVTRWEELIRAIDAQWTPVRWDSQPLLDAFPLPLAVNISDAQWNIDRRSLASLLPRPVKVVKQEARAAIRSGAALRPKLGDEEQSALRRNEEAGGIRANAPPALPDGKLVQSPESTLETIVALALEGNINGAKDAATEVVTGRLWTPMDLFTSVIARLRELNALEAARPVLRHLLISFGEQFQSSFGPSRVQAAPAVTQARAERIVEAARQGTAPDGLHVFRSKRRAEWVAFGRHHDNVALIPNMAIAGVDTPSYLGGYTPMSVLGYWVPNYTLAGAITSFREQVFHWQAHALRKSARKFISDIIFAAAGGGQNNYGHSIYQTFPSLYWYKVLKLDCPILFPHWPASMARSLDAAAAVIMSALGIPLRRRVRAEQVRDMTFALGIVPPKGELNAATVAFYREHILPAIPPAQGRATPPYVYISRQKAPARRIANESEIVTLLTRLGFVSYVPEELTFPEQLELFRNARIVAGPHGSNLTNMYFAKAGTALIEIRTITTNQDYLTLSAAAGFHYTPLWCRPHEKGFLFERFDDLERVATDALVRDRQGIGGA